ncbi:MAG: regulatory protein RecX [Gammaproteobacteria bacterium]|nr:regulatory protein RecX [Gammaproteobacteria bacterium]MDG2118299.1 regulatory protein RecX [Gammaproteobacteria bacterium]
MDTVSLRRKAMDALARREHSFFELRKKLKDKYPEAEESQIQFVLQRLRSQNLQSDARFTENFIRYRKSKGFGFYHIKNDLLGRGVGRDLIDDMLNIRDDDWIELATSLVNRRGALLGAFSFGSSEYHKLARLLKSRGFPSAVSSEILKAYIFEHGEKG